MLSAFTCYFDASGTQHDQLVVVVGGFLSTADQWIEFEKRWLERLKKAGLKNFHRKKFEPNMHPGLLEELAGIIAECATRKFLVCVPTKLYYSSIPAKEIQRWRIGAYCHAARACAGDVRMWAKSNHLHYMPQLVFATGDTGQDDLRIRLRDDGFTNVQFMPAIEKKNKKTGLMEAAIVPLQASDLMAYEMFNFSRKFERTHKRISRYNFSEAWKILDKIPGEPKTMSEVNVRKFKQVLQTEWKNQTRGEENHDVNP